MSVTFELLDATFPCDLARLVWAYFKPRDNSNEAAARYGYYEACNIDIHDPDTIHGASTGGHLEIIKACIGDALDNYACMYCACSAGQLEVVRFFMQFVSQISINTGLIGACEGNCVEAAEMMIAKGANDWNAGLHTACRYGSLEMAKLMLTHGAGDLDSALVTALCNRHPIIASILLLAGGSADTVVSYCPPELRLVVMEHLLNNNPNATLLGDIWSKACDGNLLDIIDFMIPRIEIESLRGCVMRSCMTLRSDIIHRVFTARQDPKWSALFYWAAWTGDANIIAVFSEFGYNNADCGLIGATHGLQPSIVSDMLARGATAIDKTFADLCNTYSHIEQDIRSDARNRYMAIAQLLMDHGASFCKKCNRPASEHIS